MGQHNHIVLGEVDVRLDRVSSNLDSTFKSLHGILRVLGFVATMCDSLREDSPGTIWLCPDPARCSMIKPRRCADRGTTYALENPPRTFVAHQERHIVASPRPTHLRLSLAAAV